MMHTELILNSFCVRWVDGNVTTKHVKFMRILLKKSVRLGKERSILIRGFHVFRMKNVAVAT